MTRYPATAETTVPTSVATVQERLAGEERHGLPELVGAGRQDDGDGEEEAEAGRRLAREAEQHPAGDGGPGAGAPRHERERLRAADEEGVGRRARRRPSRTWRATRSARRRTSPSPTSEPTITQFPSASIRRSRSFPATAAGSVPSTMYQPRRDSAVSSGRPRARARSPAATEPPDVRPEVDQHRQGGAGLDDGDEGPEPVVLERVAEQLAEHQQVRGGADREELGERLDDPEERGGEEAHL